MRRRGRNRKRGLRESNGRIRRNHGQLDLGTPESARRKAEIVGNADPALSATALGILCAHKQIEQGQFDAGILFAIVRSRAGFPRPFAKISQYEEWIHSQLTGDALSPLDIEDEQAARDRYELVDAALRGAGPLARTETFNVAVENRLPSWFERRRSQIVRPSDDRYRLALLSGLAALSEIFGTK